MNSTSFRLAVGLGCLIAVSACSSDKPGDTDAAGADETATAPETTDTTATAPASAPADETATTGDEAGAGLTAADVAAIEAGLAAENAVLAKAADEVAQGVDDERLTELALSVRDDALAAGVDAAGLESSRYGRLKDELFSVLGAVEMRAMLRKQGEDVDTTGLDAETVAEMKRNHQTMIDSLPDPYAGMEAGLADDIRARESRLMELRARNVGLLFKIAQG